MSRRAKHQNFENHQRHQIQKHRDQQANADLPTHQRRAFARVEWFGHAAWMGRDWIWDLERSFANSFIVSGTMEWTFRDCNQAIAEIIENRSVCVLPLIYPISPHKYIACKQINAFCNGTSAAIDRATWRPRIGMSSFRLVFVQASTAWSESWADLASQENAESRGKMLRAA
jgi:hypothetical protein